MTNGEEFTVLFTRDGKSSDKCTAVARVSSKIRDFIKNNRDLYTLESVHAVFMTGSLSNVATAAKSLAITRTTVIMWLNVGIAEETINLMNVN